ncbi:sensor histidine kinase [Methylocystis heyeri]|uniref:histidine kinase n=1 Tax=Methylocystis heyeri TaxID=391905 RepID=A0A6B8K963_9HYPH|nr:DUF4118 domain-containing protein [Methylocystis heyeri]QGM44247.1 DUF4118 domain-containing protein [Methylocystis heyeri]
MSLFKPAAGMDEYMVLPRAILSFAIGGGFLSGVILMRLGLPIVAVPVSVLAYMLAAAAASLYSNPRPGALLPRRSRLSDDLELYFSRISRPTRYLVAVVLSALGIGLNLALDTDPREHAYISLAAPIILSALLFGYEAASFALLLACAASLYFFIPPRFHFGFDDPRDVGHLCEFSAFVFLSSWVLKSMFEGAATPIKASAAAKPSPIAYEEDQFELTSLSRRLASSERKCAEAEARYDELRHRVKNEYQAFLSLAAREAEMSQNPEQFDRWILRLRNAVELHRLLDDEADETVPMATYLARLSESMRKTFDGRLKVESRVEADIGLDRRRARSLGLIYMEAAINALKYAFPGDSAGAMRLRLTRSGPNLLLTIANDGADFDPASAQPGFGFTLIKETAASLGGALAWERPPQGGACLRVIFPSGEPALNRAEG